MPLMVKNISDWLEYSNIFYFVVLWCYEKFCNCGVIRSVCSNIPVMGRAP